MRSTLKGVANESQGHSSRKKILIIEEAMDRCENYEDKFIDIRYVTNYSINGWKNIQEQI